MASKKFLELQDFSEADLKSELEATETQYQKLKFDHAIKGLDNPILLREIRRDIARLQTEIRSRELIGSSEEDLSNRSKIRARRRRK
ncbi:MAG: 50S ribosomal protein L29 [Saprospiraceae bacterium]